MKKIELFVNGKLNYDLVSKKVFDIVLKEKVKTDAELAMKLKEWIKEAGMWLNFVRCESVKTKKGWKYRVTIGKHSVDLPDIIAHDIKINREGLGPL